MDINKTKEAFVWAFKANIKRPGADALLKYMAESGFFTDPASTKYHLAYEGGLCEHSLNVYHRLLDLCEHEKASSKNTGGNFSFSYESVAIVALLHDLCKMGTYEAGYGGRYFSNDTFPFGHGEKSVYLIQKYMQLTDEEAMAIRYHMGSWNEGDKANAGKVFEKYPLAFLLHVADEFATFMDESK